MSAAPARRAFRLPDARGVVAALAGSLLLLFLIGPVAGLVGAGGVAGVLRLGSDAELRGAIALTVTTATAAVLLGMIAGTPIAWALARRHVPARPLVAAVLDLPLVIPHPVAGIALLLFLGRGRPVGNALLALGLRIVGTPWGIVAAMLFVAAPLYISGAREALAGVDRRLEGVARTLGDSPWRAFRRVTLPLAGRGLLASAVVMWARAVSEFGAIVVLTYNPKVVSVLSYDRFTNFGLNDALPVAAALALLALLPLTALRALRAESAPERS